MWKNQRVDYGARRGMILRFIAIFAGSLVGLYGLRESFGYDAPTSYGVAALAITLGLVVWYILHRAATRGVRVWVLAKGKVNHRRLARAIFVSLIPWTSRRRRRRAPSRI